MNLVKSESSSDTLVRSPIRSVTAVALILLVLPLAIACGRGPGAICTSTKFIALQTDPGVPIFANAFRLNGDNEDLEFEAPFICVDDASTNAIENAAGPEADFIGQQLGDNLRDAATELCLREFDAAVAADTDPANPIVSNDCADVVSTLGFSEFGSCVGDIESPTRDRACEPFGFFGTGSDPTGGQPMDLEPDPRTVRCRCNIREVTPDPLVAGAIAPVQSVIQDDFCVPQGEDTIVTSTYCREVVAGYLEGTIRMVSEVGGVPVSTTCANFGLGSNLVVDIECEPREFPDHSVEADGASAYTRAEQVCAPGCSTLQCTDGTPGPGTGNCTQTQNDPTCAPDDPCQVDCDCDVLFPNCATDVVGTEGVCVPDPQPDGRLRSAADLFASDWVNAELVEFESTPPDDEIVVHGGEVATLGPAVVGNGTTFTAGLQVTCGLPGVDRIGLSSFGSSLVDLCRSLPVCDGSSALDLTLTAAESGVTLGQGSLQKSGDTFVVQDAEVPLAPGDHVLEFCVTDIETGLGDCLDQPVRVAEALGSGPDLFGHVAGEVAEGFIALAGRPGATPLAVGDDGVESVRLPSGFTFPFYGAAPTTEIFVGANGGIRLTAGAIVPGNLALPTFGGDAPDIAVLWDDLDPSAGGQVLTFFDGTRFVVSWEDVPHADVSGVASVSVQAQLFTDGRVELHYADTDLGSAPHDNGASATIGIQGPDGDFIALGHNDASLLATGIAALAIDTSSCIASAIAIPPQAACTTPDVSLTVCTAKGDVVALPIPATAVCAPEAAQVVGRVVQSSRDGEVFTDLAVPIPVVDGAVFLEAGVHIVEWIPTDANGFAVFPGFRQRVTVAEWATQTNCGSASQQTVTLSEQTDAFMTPDADPRCVLALAGDDSVHTTASDDTILTGVGDDFVQSDGGDNLAVCGDGDDIAFGAGGADRLFGGLGDDLLAGGDAADLLHGGDGHDLLEGEGGEDALWGGAGDDLLKGGSGADQLFPGSGVDVVFAGAGDDLIVLLSPCELNAGEVLHGGPGHDVVLVPPGTAAQELDALGVVLLEVEQVAELPFARDHESDCS